jgi:hypothetical protein
MVSISGALWALALVVAPAAIGLPDGSDGQVRTGEVAQTASLQDTLEKGLRARRPEEFHYIGLVVARVNEGKLPLELVIGTFQWAREKAKHKNYPFPYFVRALRERAAKQGLDAP